MSLLEVRGLCKAYGGISALDDVSFDLREGEMVAMLGPNGAGKSTCFNVISGQLEADRGSVRYAGRELIGMSAQAIWRLGVGRTFQVAATFGTLSALENVQLAFFSARRRLSTFWQSARRLDVREASALLEAVDMAGQAGRACRELAYGDIKRVELAIALAHGPRLLLLDEPTAGMAPSERGALMSLTRRLVTERNLAVLLIEHSLDVVFGNADRILVLARGKVLASGEPALIRDNTAVRELYLGEPTHLYS